MKKSFLLLWLALLPLAMWAAYATPVGEWKSGLTTHEFSYTTLPSPNFVSAINVQSSVTQGSHTNSYSCASQGVGTTYPTGNSAQYTYNIYASETATTPIAASDMVAGGSYVLRVFAHYVSQATYHSATGWPDYTPAYWEVNAYDDKTFNLPFTITSKPEVTVKVFGITKEWGESYVEPTIGDFNADAALRQVTGATTNWNDVKDHLQFKRVDNGTDVGTYYYTLSLTSVHPSYTIHIDDAAAKLNITQTTNVINSVTVKDTWTYGDEVNDPTDMITVDAKYGKETATFEFFDGTESLGATIPTDAGTNYKVKVTIPETINYKEAVSAEIPFTIKKAKITNIADWADYFTPPTAVTGKLTYTEEPALTAKNQALITPAVFKESTPVVFAGASVIYDVRDSENYTVMAGATAYSAAKADTYKVYWTIKDAKNFEDYTSKPAEAVEKTIDKAPLTPVAAADANDIVDGLEYTGSPLKLLKGEFPLPEFMEVGRAGTFTYYIDGIKVTGTWEDVVGKDADEVNPTKYAITYTFKPTNSNFEEITTPLPIGNANIAKAFVKRTGNPAVVSGLTYDGTDQPLLQTGKYFSGIEGGHCIYYAQGTKEAAATEFTKYSDVKKKVNDTYTVSYKFFADDDNHKDDVDATTLGTVLIDKLEVIVAGNEYSGKIEDLYDLTAEPIAPKFTPSVFLNDISVLAVDNAKKAEILSAIVKAELPAFDALKLGDNSVKFTATPDDENETNYRANVLGATGNLKIEVTEAAIQSAPVGYGTLVYKGESQPLVKDAAVGYKAEGGGGTGPAIGKVVYSLEAAGTYTDNLAEVIVGTDATSYTVYYKAELSTEATSLDRFYEYTGGVKNITVAIDKKDLATATITLGPNNLVYTGVDQKPAVTVTATDMNGENNIIKAADFTETGVTFGGAPATELKDAGEYTFTFSGQGNYKNTTTATITIGQKTLTADMFELSATTAEYTGEKLNPAVSTKAGEPIEGKDFTYTTTPAGDMINVGTYTYTFNAATGGNYKNPEAPATVTATFTITPVDPVITDTESKNLTYNGTAQELVKAAVSADGTFKYFVGETAPEATSEEWKDAVPTAINAGSYKIHTLFIPDGNHNAGTVDPVDVTINQIKLGFDLSNMDKVWDGQPFTAKDLDKIYTLSAGEIAPADEYAIPFTLSLPKKDKDGKDITAGDAGTYHFKKLEMSYPDGAPQNYKANFTGEAEIIINKANLEAGTDFTAPEAQTPEYTGEAQNLASAGATLTAYATGIVFAQGATAPAEDAEDWATAIPAETNAGSYPVWYMVKGDKNHNNYIPTAALASAITANTLDAQLAFEDATGEDALVYTTENQMPTDLTLKDGTDVVAEADYTLTIQKDGKDVTELINVGTYVFTYTTNANYGNATVTRNIEIAPAPLATSMIAPNAVTVTYNKADQKDKFVPELKFNGKTLVEGAEADYTVAVKKDGVAYEGTEFTDAGVYTFTFSGNGNYEGSADATFTILPAKVIAEAKNATKVYDGVAGLGETKVDVTYGGLLPGDADAIVAGEGAITIKDASKNVGSYDIVLDASKFVSANYEVQNVTGATFTITPAPLAVAWNDEADGFSKVYGTADPALTATAANVEVIGVEADEAEIIANIAIVREEGEDVGDYDITLMPAVVGGKVAAVFANYTKSNEAITATTEFDDADDVFTISQATLTVSVAPGTSVYDGKAVADYTPALEDLVVTGLIGDDTKDVITTIPTATVGGGTAMTVGEYQITLAGGNADNYELTYMPAIYTITKATVTPTLTAQKVQQGKALDETAFTAEGIAEGDEDFFYVDAPGLVDMNGIVTGDPGKYANGLVLAVDEAVADNYTIAAKSAELEIISAEAIVLADNEAFAPEVKKEGVDVTFGDRTINAGDWNVCALPFEASVSQISEAFGYAAVDILNEAGSTPGEVHFKIISSGTIPAYTPFIVKTTKDEGLIKNNFNQVVFHNVTVDVWDGTNKAVPDAAGNEFIGTFQAETVLPAGSKQYWYMSKGTWYDTSTRTKDVTLKPFRAYVKFADGAETARIFVEEPDGTITAISGITAEGQLIEAEGWYTVNGMKLNAAPTEKGTYIKDGKKVLVK